MFSVTAGVLLASVALLFPQSAAAQCANCAATVSVPPGQISAFQLQNSAPGSASFASILLNNVPAGYEVVSGAYKGWCGDYDGTVVVLSPMVQLKSTYEPSVQAQNPNWPKANYILNHKQGTYQDVQRAIWEVLYPGRTPGLFPSTSASQSMVAAANANPTFMPAQGQILALLLVQDGPGGQQDTFIEVPAPECGVIGDLVWNDTNRDGLQSAGEPGINGVTVKLRNSSSQVIATTVTSTVGPLAGMYKFPGLCAGTYTVEVTDGPGTVLQGLTPTGNGAGPDRAVDSNGSPAVVSLATDRSQDLTIDFGYQAPCTGTIGNFVWNDLNNDGIQDEDEPGLDNVQVKLYNASKTSLLGTATTVGGMYSFTGRCAGTYVVEVDNSTVPSGFTPTLVTAEGSTTEDDSNANPSVVTLADDNDVDNTIDFGYRAPCTGTIGDYVWHDRDRNGIQGAGDVPLANVGLRLLNGANQVIRTAVTNADGAYMFENVCAGTYKVELDSATVPSGFTSTIPNAPGSTTENDSNPVPSSVVLVGNNGSDRTIDFGFLSPCAAVVGDFVWMDTNRDGVQNAGELGIAGVTVNLRSATDNSLLASTKTNDLGAYQFTGRCFGGYKVEVVPPANTTASPVGAGTPATDSNPNPTAVTLGDNTVDNTIDFGFMPSCVATIGDRVFKDLNKNGIQDYGDFGLPLQIVTLTDLSTGAVSKTMTDLYGYYKFKNRCPGNYKVEVGSLPGLVPAPSMVGTNRAVDSNGSPANVTIPVSGTSDLTIDFGFMWPCTGVIGNFVWVDTNRNGRQDSGEPGLPGVPVTLLDASGATLASTTTDSNGGYQFTGRCAGSYTVQVGTKTGYTPTATGASGTTTANDSNVNPSKVTLPTDNSADLTVDFGYITNATCTGSIGDFVWYDVDGDGIQDTSEVGINGVLVKLLNASTGSVLQTDITDISGKYKFTGLCAGNYKVVVVPPAGLTASKIGARGSTTANDSNASPSAVTLSTDSSADMTVDFGFVPGDKCMYSAYYWKNHPTSWPVTTLMLGSESYSKDELLNLLKSSVKTNVSITLAQELIAAKLNLAAKASAAGITSTINSADGLLAQYSGKLPYTIPTGSKTTLAKQLTVTLEKYNDGDLPGSCRCN